jgi:hypothetical protein
MAGALGGICFIEGIAGHLADAAQNLRLMYWNISVRIQPSRVANMQTLAFRLRRNLDGSYASICPRCYRTAAAAKTREELEELNQQHVCDPEGLVWLSYVLAHAKDKWDG